MLVTILAHVNGSVSRQVCEALAKLASKVPSGGAILDLNCGEGRSTIVLAHTLEERGKDVVVMAVDTHVVNPFSETPYQEGTAMKFLANARRFRLAHRIVPIVCTADVAGKVVGKRCANLIVVQSPATVQSVYHADALAQALEIARYAIRRYGTIAVICPNPAYQVEFDALVARHFVKGFVLTYNSPELKTYEFA